MDTVFYKYTPISLYCQAILLLFLFFIFIQAPQAAESSDPVKSWVIFNDKGFQIPVTVADRAYERRLQRANGDISRYDLAVENSYIRTLKDSGAKVRTVSRWLNAASIEADESALSAIRNLPFVQEIRPVSTYTMPLPEKFEFGFRAQGGGLFDYGPSAAQIGQIHADSLHDLGLSGNGVIIGMMDTGFDLNHPAFARMLSEHKVLITHDFINGDSDVVDGFDIQRSHGTSTLSVLGGYAPGSLIGPAFGAEFILAKTEIYSREIQIEEDYWVAASEWMESLGVDIISSSLGYIDWYDTTQLDGRTALITRAADAACSLGVVVVNCAGNEGNNPIWHKVSPPSDGFLVIAVGAVDANGVLADFSSRGPTADGRIKPELCAMGVMDYVADYGTGAYSYSSGTSFSAPLIAGAVALLLEGHPDWDLPRIRSVLKGSSSQATHPDNNYGWGIPDMVRAFYPGPPAGPSNNLALSIYPHPATDSVVFHLTIPEAGRAYLSVHDISGTKINEWRFDAAGLDTLTHVWNGRNDFGGRVASGVYICDLKMAGNDAREKLYFISTEP